MEQAKKGEGCLLKSWEIRLKKTKKVGEGQTKKKRRETGKRLKIEDWKEGKNGIKRASLNPYLAGVVGTGFWFSREPRCARQTKP